MTELLVSIVSHRQGNLAAHLLQDLDLRLQSLDAQIVLTLNVDEPTLPQFEQTRLPVRVLRNRVPRGFAANHNAAFATSPSRNFCVLNPDIRLLDDPFRALLPLIGGGNAVAAPAVISERGLLEDSARRLPTPMSILLKAFTSSPHIDYEYRNELIYPDWVAGMFMLCDSKAFEEIGGFDERYFLYYEDVDLCCRLRLAGKRVVVNPCVRVVHDARRASRRDARYLYWHLQSMLRFFKSPVYRGIRKIR